MRMVIVYKHFLDLDIKLHPQCLTNWCVQKHLNLDLDLNAQSKDFESTIINTSRCIDCILNTIFKEFLPYSIAVKSVLI